MIGLDSMIGITLILRCNTNCKKLDGTRYNAERISVINGSHSLIIHMTIRSAGKIVYDTDNLYKVTFVKNLLEYSDDFSRSVAKNSFWYLDTSHLKDTADNNPGFEARRLLTRDLQQVNTIIPLNRYSFFEELEERMLSPMQLQLEITLQNDSELIYGLGGGDAGRVVVNRFLLWVPKLTPKDSLYEKFVNSYVSASSWIYKREMYNVSSPMRTSGFFQISPSIDNVKAILYIYNEIKQKLKQRIRTYLTLLN